MTPAELRARLAALQTYLADWYKHSVTRDAYAVIAHVVQEVDALVPVVAALTAAPPVKCAHRHEWSHTGQLAPKRGAPCDCGVYRWGHAQNVVAVCGGCGHPPHEGRDCGYSIGMNSLGTVWCKCQEPAPAGGRDTTPPPLGAKGDWYGDACRQAAQARADADAMSAKPAADAAPRPGAPTWAMLRDADAKIAALTAQVTALTAELAHWKICENCGKPLDGPGICSQAISEKEKGLEEMHEQTLTRAEKAEAEVTALRQSLTACEDALNTAHETVDKLAADIATARSEATADVLARVREKAIVGRWPKNYVCQCVLCGQIWVGVNPEPHEDDCPLRVPDARATPKSDD